MCGFVFNVPSDRNAFKIIVDVWCEDGVNVQKIVGLLFGVCSAIAVWHLFASYVFSDSLNSISFGNSGIAVMSFVFSAVMTCPRLM